MVSLVLLGCGRVEWNRSDVALDVWGSARFNNPGIKPLTIGDVDGEKTCHCLAREDFSLSGESAIRTCGAKLVNGPNERQVESQSCANYLQISRDQVPSSSACLVADAV